MEKIGIIRIRRAKGMFGTKSLEIIRSSYSYTATFCEAQTWRPQPTYRKVIPTNYPEYSTLVDVIMNLHSEFVMTSHQYATHPMGILI